MGDVISVIIPVYRTEAYLPKCLDSVISQSYTDLEILLIDDGSPDRCGEICDQYAAKDSRIRVIHQKNGGAANAKNTGLRTATGEYLAFLDADDYLEPGAYERLIREMADARADVVQGSFRDVYRENAVDHVMLPERQFFGAEDYLLRYTKDWTCGLLWDKLYRRDLYDGIFFEEGHKIDDEFFTYQGIMKAERILRIPDIVYNYRKRASSVTQISEAKQQIVLDKLDYLEKRRTRVLARFPNLKQDFDYHFLSMLLILAGDPAATEKSIRITQRILKEYFHTQKPCRMEPSMRLKLLRLQYAAPARLLRAGPNADPEQTDSSKLFD